MNILEATARWYGCPYGLQKCHHKCPNYMLVDPRTYSGKGVGPGPTGQRTLCGLLEDLSKQVMSKTNDSRLIE